MRQVLTVLLVLTASFGIVHGDLLRPCQCGPENPLSCGQCAASRAEEPDEKPCCCCDEPAPAEAPCSEGEPDACGICPGPRAPRDVPTAPVTFEPPLPISVVDVLADVPTLPLATIDAQEAAALPAAPPWRISPEGLTVFLT